MVTKPEGEIFWQSMVDRGFGTKVAGFDAERRAALDEAIERAFEPYVKDGQVHLRSTERVACGVA